MGIIKRQGIKSTIVSYGSVIVSAFAMLFIYSGNDEIYGHAMWIFSIATLLLPFSAGGLHNLIVKYFPTYNTEDSKNYNGFLTLVLSGLTIGYVLFLLLWYFFNDHIVRLLEMAHIPNASLIKEYEVYILTLLGLIILLRFLVRQAWNSLRTVVPDIIEKFGYKLFLPTLILIYAYYGLTIEQFTWALVGFFAVACLALIIYLRHLGTLKFGRIKKPSGGHSYKDMASFAGYGVLNSLGTSMATRLDSIMIPLFIDMANNSFYSKAAFMANVLDYPSRSINQIASPIISKAWKENNLTEISMIYKKAGANLFLLGCLVFLVIWYGLDDLVQLSADPSTFPQVRNIFLLLGATKLVDMLTSVNSHILVYSKLYRYNMLFLLILGGLNVVLNLKLIPAYAETGQGILGAAVATAISLFVFNVVKTIFIFFKFGLQPFTVANFKTLFLLAIFMALYFVIPSSSMPFLNLIYKTAFVGLSYLAIAYLWRISDDANELGINFIKRFIKV